MDVVVIWIYLESDCLANPVADDLVKPDAMVEGMEGVVGPSQQVRQGLPS